MWTHFEGEGTKLLRLFDSLFQRNVKSHVFWNLKNVKYAFLNTGLIHSKTIKNGSNIYNKYVRLRGMTIQRPHAARFYELRISSATFTSAPLYGNVYIRAGVAGALADSSDLGLLGERSSPKCEIPCLGRSWTAVHVIGAAGFISGGEIRNGTKRHTYSNRHIHILPIRMYGWSGQF